MTSLLARSANALEAYYAAPRPKLLIQLRDHDQDHVPVVSSLDSLRGEVVVSTESDLPFDQLNISLTGTSRMLVEKPGVATPTVARSSAFHTFLRLTQPVDDARYPTPRVLRAGQVYRFPFTFVVPDRLLPDACHHNVHHPLVHAAHTRLPPSLGDDPATAPASRDDMAPESVEIKYAVRARLTKRVASPHEQEVGVSADDEATRTVGESARKIRIVPASEEHPPLDVPHDSRDYCLRREKAVKKGPLRKKIGRLVMTAAQPKPFHLTSSTTSADDRRASVVSSSRRRSSNPEHKNAEEQPTTMVKLRLRFDPADENQQPPRLGTLWSQLKATTYFATDPWPSMPSVEDCSPWAVKRGSETRNVCLATRCIASATWQKHSSEDEDEKEDDGSSSASSSRRGSVSSTSSSFSECSASHSYAGHTYYTTSIVVPLTLPPKKIYAPTFHSCLAARTYALNLSLSYHAPGTTSFGAPRFALQVPVQVMGPGTLAPSDHASAAAHAAAAGVVTTTSDLSFPPLPTDDEDMTAQAGEDDADEAFFTPRTIRAPLAEYTERASLPRGPSAIAEQDAAATATTAAPVGPVTSAGVGRGRSSTSASGRSRAPSYRARAAPPEYPFGRRVSNRIVRTAC